MIGSAVGATRVTATFAVIALAHGLIYIGPRYWYRRPLPDGQVSIVATIESWGPVWPVVFILAGALLGYAAWKKAHIALAHSVAAGVWVFYAMAVLLSAYYSVPPGPILTGAIALGAAAAHWSMIRVWADVGVK